MQIVSINVGLPREIEWGGQTVTTSIFKAPVAGPVVVGRLNLEGDRQSDLTVHGGSHKAVYVYPAEHYAEWSAELGAELDLGVFGENFTTVGLLEDTIQIGDRLHIGTAEFVVTQPRLPCYKLGIRFQRADMEKRFLASSRTGFYLRVSQEGIVAAGDAIRVTPQSDSITVKNIVKLYSAEQADPGLARRASELADLPEGWRIKFRARLTQMV